MNARKHLTIGTQKQHKNFYNKFLCEFPLSAQYRQAAKQYKLTWELTSITTEFWLAYLKWGVEEHSWFDNYLGSQTKNIKAFMRYCEVELELPVCKQYRNFIKPTEELEVIYLTKYELDLIYAYRDHVNESDKKVIDLCILGNMTGLRISDLLVNFKSKIKRVESEKFITDETQKTKGTYFIPFSLSPYIGEIMERYDYNMRLMTDVHFNRRIKEVLTEVFNFHNINQEEIEVYHSVNGEKVLTEKGTKASLYTSHNNRRGMITRLYHDYNFVNPKETILTILSGKNIKILDRYIKKDAQLKAKQLGRINFNVYSKA
jgi:hypothetical protein